MEELIKAVESLSQNTIFDYLIVIVPILLSIAAIVVSVYTVHKQNKIALFEMRYKALTQLDAILMCEEAMYKNDNPESIMEVFNMGFDSNLKVNKEDDYVKIAMITKQIYFDVGIVSPILKKNAIDPEDLIISFADVITDAFFEETNAEAQENFHAFCVKLKPVYVKLNKQIYP